jgi:hypothetical protein
MTMLIGLVLGILVAAGAGFAGLCWLGARDVVSRRVAIRAAELRAEQEMRLRVSAAIEQMLGEARRRS